MTRHVGVYPGTFDPVTGGHTDIIRRARRLVDHLIIAVAVNAGKGPMFGVDDRIDMVAKETAAFNQDGGCTVEVRPFETLLVHVARDCGAQVIIRGLRAVSDFDYEFQMCGMNARIEPNVETLFLMASERQQFVSSRFVKEIARLGGDAASFVSPAVHERLMRRIEAERKAGTHKDQIGAPA
ncbi:MAG: pantetheine-phosphate adenylyltransferase [Alphaproteobacteria bacterium]|nr:pantetheine-phosphate adenylyltransferase [Alphaproteobacteria bacterium]